MTTADRIFINTCEKIIYTGESTVGTKVRPKWRDGKPAHTSHITSVVNVYDVGKEFPILTIRPTPITGPVKEILWIYQKKSNNINDLGMHIWDSWADESGSIGKAYGYQIGLRYRHHKMNQPTPPDEIKKLNEFYPSYDVFGVPRLDGDGNPIGMDYYGVLDQMDAVLWDLRETPSSRRIMTGTYNFNDLYAMGLHPCAHSTTWNVFEGKLNLILNQRSQDMLAASAFNVMEYSALLVMVAKATGLKVGTLTHVISDCHIYDRHIPIVKELIERSHDLDLARRNKNVKVLFSSDSTNFYDYSPSNWRVDNYDPAPQVKFEVAI